MRSVVVAVAITGSVPRKRDNPAVPISATEQIVSTHEAFEAGASLVHIHVRNADESPSSDPELFARVQEGVKRHCPGMIIQFSTGGARPRSKRARECQLSQARHGLALYRFRQLPDDRVRELGRVGRRPRGADAGIRCQAGD